VTYAELTRKLRELGCVFKRQAKGSHEIWHNPRVNRSTVVPNHPGSGFGPRSFLTASRSASMSER
jgi:predicted RNA binding protein YcfA (HicA-like mRNA interferase family)